MSGLLNPDVRRNTLKLYILLTLCLLLSYAANSTAATDIWSTVSVIHDDIDGLFYTGSEFAAYRLAPTLQLYTSDNGTEWTAHSSSLSPLSIGHDGQGVYYALTRTQQETGTPGYYYYTAHVWKSSDASTWEYLESLVTYIGIVPVSASFCGNGSILLVKLYNIWGGGWVSGSPTQPLFVADIATPTNFVQVQTGQNIDNILWTGSRFVATSNSIVITSSNGSEWSSLFSLSGAYPPDKIMATWESLFFIFGHFTGITIANSIAEAVPLNSPSYFNDLFRPVVAFAYNGNSLVVADEDTSYVSTNFSQTWSSNDLTSVRGLAYNGSSYFIGDQVDTNLVVYKFTPTTNIVTNFIPLRMDVQPCESVRFHVTNTFTGALLYSSDTNCATPLVQYEVSGDLHEWYLLGLPTTNAPVIVDIDQIDSPTAFFRMQEVKWE